MTSSASHDTTTPGKSPAFQFYPKDFISGTVTLSTEEVGAYILLMCHAWDHGEVPLGNIHRSRIARLSPARMKQAWVALETKFEQTETGFIQPRIEREREKQAHYRRRQSDKGKASAANRKATGGQPESNRGSTVVETRLQPKPNSALSDLQSASPISVLRKPQPPPTDARSKRPIYQSDRFVVFEWQFDDLAKTLGSHVETFDLHAFFDDLSRRSRDAGLVIPRSEAWAWLQAELLTEAKRRGLPIVSTTAPIRDRAAEERAQDERILASIQEDRRAGR